MSEPAILVAPVVIKASRRSNAEIMRIGDAQRQWRARPWWYRILFRARRPKERLTIAELIFYQTLQTEPLLERVLAKALYGGPGRTILGAHSQNELPKGQAINEEIRWRS